MGERKSRGGVFFLESKRGAATYRGKKGHWYIDYYAGPTLKDRVRQKTRALSKTEAVTIRNTTLADLERGELRLPVSRKSVLLHTLSEEYLAAAKINRPPIALMNENSSPPRVQAKTPAKTGSRAKIRATLIGVAMAWALT